MDTQSPGEPLADILANGYLFVTKNSRLSAVAIALISVSSLIGVLLIAGNGGSEASARIGGASRKVDQPVIATGRKDANRADPATIVETPLTIDIALNRARPFEFTGPASDRQRAAECLAAAAWYEIGNDRIGQRAVIQTVINRVNHPGFPNSVCGVVFEGSQRKTGCQFTFTCDGSLGRRRPSAGAWKLALEVANDALDGYVDQSIGTATHYHADYVSPWWSRELQRLTAVGPHIFYRWGGTRGSLNSPAYLESETDFDLLVERSLARQSEDRASEASLVPQPNQVDSASAQMTATSASGSVQEDAPAGLMKARTVIFLQVEGQLTGQWAVSAMRRCQGKTACQVFGYSDQTALRENRSRQQGHIEKPVFLFLRDAHSGMELALWDCDTVNRPSINQCLPAEGAALRSLLTER